MPPDRAHQSDPQPRPHQGSWARAATAPFCPSRREAAAQSTCMAPCTSSTPPAAPRSPWPAPRWAPPPRA